MVTGSEFPRSPIANIAEYVQREIGRIGLHPDYPAETTVREVVLHAVGQGSR